PRVVPDRHNPGGADELSRTTDRTSLLRQSDCHYCPVVSRGADAHTLRIQLAGTRLSVTNFPIVLRRATKPTASVIERPNAIGRRTGGQRLARLVENPANAPGCLGIHHAGVEEEIEPRHLLAEDMNLLPGVIKQSVD